MVNVKLLLSLVVHMKNKYFLFLREESSALQLDLQSSCGCDHLLSPHLMWQDCISTSLISPKPSTQHNPAGVKV